MRLSVAAAAVLLPLLLAAVTAQNGNDAVVHPAPTNADDPIVNIAFYENVATMPGEGGQGQNLCPGNATGRTFRAEVTGDDGDGGDDDGTCYEMSFFLESQSRHAKVVSCPGDKSILDVTSSPSSLSDGTSPLTTDERTFLCNVASSVEKHDEDIAEIVSSYVHSLESQLARAARLLCSWPDALGVSYTYEDATAGGGGIGGINLTPIMILGNDPSVPPDDDLDDSKRTRVRRSLLMEKQSRAGIKSLRGGQGGAGSSGGQGRRGSESDAQEGRTAATSSDMPHIYPLCDDIGSWFQSSDGTSYAQIGSDRPCENEGMRIHDGSRWTCFEPMESPPPRYGPPPDWSHGFCFGQCGGGGCATNGLAQYLPFTSDCAHYDYCDRFGIGAEGGGNGGDDDDDDEYNCHEIFLNTVDDWMWGANCNASKDGSGRCYAIPAPQMTTTTTTTTPINPNDGGTKIANDEGGGKNPPIVVYGDDSPIVVYGDDSYYYSSSPEDFIPYEIKGIGGLDDCDDLENGIRQAAEYLVNEAIKLNAEYGCYEGTENVLDEASVFLNYTAAFEEKQSPEAANKTAIDDTSNSVVTDASAAAAASASAVASSFVDASASVDASADAGSASGLEDSYQTNKQEDEVDEADLVKSDGKIIVAVYSDNLFVVDAATLEVRSQITHSYDLQAEVLSSRKIDPSTAIRYSPAEVASLLNSTSEHGGGNNFRRRLHETNESVSIEEPFLTSIDPNENSSPPETTPNIVALLLLESSNRLVVVLQVYPLDDDFSNANRPILSGYAETHVRLYDISDPSNPTPIGTKLVNGWYIAARAVGNIVHLITSSWIDTSFHLQGYFERYREEYVGLNRTGYIAAAQAKSKHVIDSFVARLRDEITAKGSGSCEDITRISSFGTMDAAGGSSGDDASSSTATGDGSATLELEDLLQSFVHITSLDATQGPPPVGGSLSTAQAGVFVPGQESWVYASEDVIAVPALRSRYDMITGNWEPDTLLFVFALQADGSAAQGIGTAYVPGYTTLQGSHNQFALDEYQGLLRVATTKPGEYGCIGGIDPDIGCCLSWGSITNSTSQVTILRLPEASTSNQVIEWVSVIEIQGDTEDIYAVRFIDSKAFIVTVAPTDPFYSIDFSNPTDPNPPVRELSHVTGFLHYLHPYDPEGNIILAVGENADSDGWEWGLQIYLIDVSDLSNPTLMHKYFEGTHATNEAGQDHKAFRFVRRSNFADGGGGLLILPLSQYTYEANGNMDGFKLYDVSAANGIKYLFDVTHATSEQIAYWCWSYGTELPPRSFLIGGDLITTKKRSIVKTDLDTKTLEWKLDMESSDDTSCYYCY